MMYMLWSQTVRNLKVFLKDKANIFFALLAPIIVFGLYILFLGKIQSDALLVSLEEMGVTGKNDLVRAFCDSWMLSGVLASACITVPLCACGVMVQDKKRGITADLLASPVPAWLPTAAYFFAVVIAGLILALAVLALCLVYLAASGTWYLSAGDVFGLLGTYVLSVLSSSTLLVFVVGFLRTEGAFTGLNVILGTVIGFLIGAYMPLSVLPKAVQYITLLIPGSYSAALMRNFFLGGVLERISADISAEFSASLGEQFVLRPDFFGAELGMPATAGILAGFAVLFAAATLLAAFLRVRRAR